MGSNHLIRGILANEIGKTNMGQSRSSQKRITKESIILRHMRMVRKISLNKAGALLNITGSAIAHIEAGRMEVSRARVAAMINAYGFSQDEYLEFFDGKELPLNLREECIGIIHQLDEVRLQAVHAVLVNFMPIGSVRSARSPEQNQRISPG